MEDETTGQARDRRVEAVARVWQSAMSDIAYLPYPAHEVRVRFERLLAGALEALATEADPDALIRQGRVIGRELVGLNLLRAEALERTQACLGQELAGAAEPAQLGRLLAGIAGGFTGAAETALLAQQEAIGRAANSALRQAQSELETSRDRLAAANVELSAQIAERTRAEEIQRDYAERLQRLHRIDLAVLSAESLTAIVDISIDYIAHLIPAISTSITLFDLANKRSIILSSTNPAYPAGRNLKITMTAALDWLAAGNILYIEDLHAIRETSSGVAEIADLGGRSVLAVPLRYRDELIGSLMIILSEVRRFSATEETVARELADSLAVAIQNRRLLEAEQAARERETTLREVAASLTLGLDLDELLERILIQLNRVVPNNSASVMLLNDGELEVTAQWGTRSDPDELELLLYRRPRSIWSVIERLEPFIIDDTHGSPDWVVTRSREYIRAWLGVPLLVKGICIGVLTIDRDETNAFNDEDKELAMTFANQAAIAIDNARLFARQQAYAGELQLRVRERTRELEVLYGITATAVGNPELDSLLRRSLELTTDAFSCAASAIHLIENEDSLLQLSAVHEQRPQMAEALRWLAPGDPLLQRPLQGGAPVILNSHELPPGWPRDASLVLVVVPLRSRGHGLGVLSLLCDSPHHLAGEGLTLLTTIADQLGSAVENIRLRQITRQTAIIEERERLSREIHDAITQAIYGIALFAEAAGEAAEARNIDKVHYYIQSILSSSDHALRELRLLMFELRTEQLARLGLVEALRERLRMVEHRADIAGEVHARKVNGLPVPIEEAFYRIALEALNNALRHARARHVDIAVAVEGDHLMMTIADDGVGFDVRAANGKGGMGLESMRKRIGKVDGRLTLASRPGEGTQVIVRAPLKLAGPASVDGQEGK